MYHQDRPIRAVLLQYHARGSRKSLGCVLEGFRQRVVERYPSCVVVEHLTVGSGDREYLRRCAGCQSHHPHRRRNGMSIFVQVESVHCQHLRQCSGILFVHGCGKSVRECLQWCRCCRCCGATPASTTSTTALSTTASATAALA